MPEKENSNWFGTLIVIAIGIIVIGLVHSHIKPMEITLNVPSEKIETGQVWSWIADDPSAEEVDSILSVEYGKVYYVNISNGLNSHRSVQSFLRNWKKIR